MKKKYHVKLTETERKEILAMINRRNASKTIRNRCNILLMADESVGKAPSQEEISKRCGVCDVTVYKTVKDYHTLGLGYVFRRRKETESSKQPKVNGEVEARIVALACSEPPAGYSRWTVRLLTQRVIELKILETVGRETIRTTLKKRNSNRI
jgi:transposase